MSAPEIHSRGRGTLAAIVLLACLITLPASPLVTDLGAQTDTLEFVQQPQSAEAGQTMPDVSVHAPDVPFPFSVTIMMSVASGPGSLDGTVSQNANFINNDTATFSDLSIQIAGTYTLLAEAEGYTSATSASFQITPGPPDGGESEISASPDSIPADGVSTSTITVQLRDEFGNPLTGGGESVSLSTTLGTLGPVADNGNGTYTATLTSSTTSGTATISGLVNGSDITDDAMVTFTQVPPTLLIDVQPADTRVDEPISPAVVVRVVDGLGTTLTEFTGNATAFLASNPGGATLSGDQIEPFQGGIATFDDLRLDRTADNYRLGFSAPGAVDATSATFDVLAGAASPATTTINASPVSIPADGSSTSRIEVTLRDAAGVPLAAGGDDVDLSTTIGTLSAVQDNRDGTYTATLRSTIAPGTATISGTLNGVPISDTATVAFAAGSADLEVTVEVSDETPGIGDEVVHVVTVINLGPDHATGVQVTRTSSPRLDFISATTSQGEYEPASGIWSVGTLAEGERATLTIVARVLDRLFQ